MMRLPGFPYPSVSGEMHIFRFENGFSTGTKCYKYGAISSQKAVCFLLLGTAVDANTIRQGKFRSSRVWPPNEMIPNDRHAVYVAPPSFLFLLFSY